jgi:hypothetical protein
MFVLPGPERVPLAAVFPQRYVNPTEPPSNADIVETSALRLTVDPGLTKAGFGEIVT